LIPDSTPIDKLRQGGKVYAAKLHTEIGFQSVGIAQGLLISNFKSVTTAETNSLVLSKSGSEAQKANS
jgi:hypothetical protein